MNSITTIYSHPDGHQVAVGNGLLTACTSEGTDIAIPIGAEGLAELGNALLACAAAVATVETEQDDAKHAGAALACDLVNDIAQLHGNFHQTAVRAVCRALGNLTKQDNLEHAIAGFAQMLTNTLVCGVISMALAGEIDE